MTKRELIDYCLSFPTTYEDYPFDETTALARHMGNKKMFALVDY
jgi:predicted DNA-binding protein (MmcQ/YjbR family)